MTYHSKLNFLGVKLCFQKVRLTTKGNLFNTKPVGYMEHKTCKKISFKVTIRFRVLKVLILIYIHEKWNQNDFFSDLNYDNILRDCQIIVMYLATAIYFVDDVLHFNELTGV